MRLRRTITAVSVTATATLLLGGCSPDKLFSNLNGTSTVQEPPAEAADQQPAPDAPPNYADNRSAQLPKAIAPRDAGAARRLAAKIEPFLESRRRSGTFAPDQLGPALERLAAPNRVTVTPLRTDARSSGFGVYVGDTGCVHGAVTEKRIWIDVTGHYPETGCVTPPPAH